ncbi:MAG: isoaspartyl peptidase/L-asparaginase family protein [Balneolaceae bacterium]
MAHLTTYFISAIFLAFSVSQISLVESDQLYPNDGHWAIALHGGAGTISKDLPDSVKQQYFNALEEALEIGENILRHGGSALDAVENVIIYLENSPLFNAGKGSVFTSEGTHELDAAFMYGNTLQAGALTGLTTVKNPITLARKVMEESVHIFFSGQGAEQFADEMNVERVENDYFHTQRRYEQWQRSQQQSENTNYKPAATDFTEYINESKFGTVGAVAVDKEGNIVAGTSTGGMTNKRFGRVGDVPIIGSGTYANSLVAVSATGWGEQIMRNISAHTIAARMEFAGDNLEAAMDFVLEDRLNPGDAGFIATDRDGNIVMKMNTSGMFRAGSNSNGYRNVAIWEDGEK